MAQPLTEVRLLSVPLENDYIHTYYFDTAAKQEEFMKARTIKTYVNLTYQRKENSIRIPDHCDSLLNCNYVMYKNANYSNKWFYAFITDFKYINDDRTDIEIETDVLQTWHFNYTVKPSFVEREHVNDDTIGLHTVPEQLETGDYIINKKNKNASLLAHSLIMACTVDLNDYDDALIGGGSYAAIGGKYYNGVYSGIRYYEMTKAEVNTAIKKLANTGQSDAIVSIFSCPSIFVKSTYPEGSGKFAEVDENMSAIRKDWVNTLGVEDTENYKPTNIDGYTPNNNKLFTYPYCYMLMSNNSGGSAVYKYELFNNPEEGKEDLCAFYIYSAITPGFSICISPRYYNGVDINSLEALSLGKYPICAWTTDVYTNWLTQNAVNIPLSIGSALVSSTLAVGSALLAPATGGASAVATLAAVGSVASSIGSITSTMSEIYQHSLQPAQAEGNINNGDVTFATGTLTFTAYQMTIKKEYAKMIDGYFNMFGYKVNTVKTPLKNHRESFWYTKTIDVNIDGAVPGNDLRKIKECYNNGFTFWKNHNSIGNYSVSNKII